MMHEAFSEKVRCTGYMLLKRTVKNFLPPLCYCLRHESGLLMIVTSKLYSFLLLFQALYILFYFLPFLFFPNPSAPISMFYPLFSVTEQCLHFLSTIQD